ncbi:MAG: hypothetical protein IJN59_02250 [Oscillospiraceae bacterium]|nr:hypothetical protein [Oscillospiraceae bacterium]
MVINNKFYEKFIFSKSKIAIILRLLAWLLLIVAIGAGVVESFNDAEPVPLFLYTFYAAGAMLLLYTVAAIIHYLAEITDILKRNADNDRKNC